MNTNHFICMTNAQRATLIDHHDTLRRIAGSVGERKQMVRAMDRILELERSRSRFLTREECIVIGIDVDAEMYA